MRRGTLAATGAILAAFFAVAASAATPSYGPDLPTMALATSDFGPGAKLAYQGFKPPTSARVVAYYERDFGPAVRLGGRRLLSVVNFIDAFADAGTASVSFDQVRTTLSTSSGRTQLGKVFVGVFNEGTRGALKARLVAVGNLIPVGLGQGAFRLLVRIKTKTGTVELAFDALQLDRAIGFLLLASYPKKQVGASTSLLAMSKLAAHFQYGFTVRNLTPPTITGAPQAGQTLTADPGQWAGAPSSFAYQWSRCDGAGANCTAIPGAVSQTYVLGTAESGARVTVVVTAANTVSSIAMPATPTAPVR